MSSPIKEVTVAVGVIHRNANILLSRRRQDTHLGGYWEFPGGKQEPHETAAQTVAREVLEEVGLEVRVGRCFHRESHQYPERWVHISFYFCEPLDQREPRALQVNEWKWVQVDRLSEVTFPDANRAAVEKIVEAFAAPT